MPKNRDDRKHAATAQTIDMPARKNDPILQLKNCSPLSCAELVLTAERELAAYISAVTEAFGTEVARLAAEDWLEELSLLPPESLAGKRDVRSVSIAASLRLTKRILPSNFRLSRGR